MLPVKRLRPIHVLFVGTIEIMSGRGVPAFLKVRGGFASCVACLFRMPTMAFWHWLLQTSPRRTRSLSLAGAVSDSLEHWRAGFHVFHSETQERSAKGKLGKVYGATKWTLARRPRPPFLDGQCGPQVQKGHLGSVCEPSSSARPARLIRRGAFFVRGTEQLETGR